MKKITLQQQIKDHIDDLKLELNRLTAERKDAHDLKLHLKPVLDGRIMEVEKEIEHLLSLLHD
jgi:hypothetical protein